MGTLEDGTLGDPACSALDVALAEYRWAKDRLEVLFFYAGYWQAIVASAAAECTERRSGSCSRGWWRRPAR